MQNRTHIHRFPLVLGLLLAVSLIGCNSNPEAPAGKPASPRQPSPSLPGQPPDTPQITTDISKELQAIIDNPPTQLTEDLLNAVQLQDDEKQLLRDIDAGNKPVDSILSDSVSQQYGRTALHLATLATPIYTTVEKVAAEQQSIKLMAWLINKGAKVNQPDTAGLTPLHMAAGRGSLEAVKFLLAKGADPNAKTTDAYFGETVLHKAIERAIIAPTPVVASALKIIEALLQKGANKNVQNRDGKTPLQKAKDENAFNDHIRKQKEQVIALLEKAQ